MRKIAEYLSTVVQPILTVIAIVVGGGFAWFEYSNHESLRKLQSSFEFVSEFSGEELQQDRARLAIAWINSDNEWIALSNSEPDDDKAHIQHGIDLVTQHNHQDLVMRVLSFFERVAICANTEICDKEINDAIFLEHGNAIFDRYSGYLCEVRAKTLDPDLLLELERYLRTPDAEDLCSNS